MNETLVLLTTVAIIIILGHENNLDNFRITLGEAKENHQRQDTFALLHNNNLLAEYLAKSPLKNRSRTKTRALVLKYGVISKITP